MELSTFFQQHPQGALALSGGVDSALLAWAAGRWGSGWRAYFAHTAFQPAHELTDAQALARLCGLPLTVLEVDVLSDPQVAANPARRCYFCKRALFSAIAQAAKEDGLSLIADGTNASDDYSRNLIRHHVIPVLRKINPELHLAVARTAKLLGEDEDCLGSLADEFIREHYDGESLPVSKLRELHRAVASRVLRRLCLRGPGTPAGEAPEKAPADRTAAGVGGALPGGSAAPPPPGAGAAGGALGTARRSRGRRLPAGLGDLGRS